MIFIQTRNPDDELRKWDTELASAFDPSSTVRPDTHMAFDILYAYLCFIWNHHDTERANASYTMNKQRIGYAKRQITENIPLWDNEYSKNQTQALERLKLIDKILVGLYQNIRVNRKIGLIIKESFKAYIHYELIIPEY
ncbi:hypothetical protein SCHPADRAFT_977835 [Schizopora paradoxa]|uniref:Uncharacterized protein n=1 Tax=Schizopora paradoxa TaxID=27342 RepID=A0A0H2REK1_9AGAM|nr:hypothetical protein SCHPADRAFT_977835 [Schizopora paradoxa]